MSSSVLGFRVCGIQDTCWKTEICEGVGISVADDSLLASAMTTKLVIVGVTVFLSALY